MSLVCAQLVRKGRYVAAVPWFEGGHQHALADARRWHSHVGELVLLDAPVYGPSRVVEILGPSTSVAANMRGLLGNAGLLGSPPIGRRVHGWAPGDWPAAVEEELAQLPNTIPGADQRRDLRHQPCFTIDPPGAKDHDDALFIAPADDAGQGAQWELWVHIADVSAYVRTGSAIDHEAQRRAMSAYVPGAVAPMLPGQLSSNLCSLLPGQDRPCVSIRALLDEAGKVTSRSFHRTIIRSARRLTYAEVDELLGESGSAVPDTFTEIRSTLGLLDRVTRLLSDTRMKQGALDIAALELAFDIETHEDDGQGTRVVAARMEQASPSHRMVEECMLLANNQVGALLEAAGAGSARLPALWRVHEHPDPVAVDHLVRLLSLLDVPTPPVPEHLTGQQAARLASQIAERVRRYTRARGGRGAAAFMPRVLRALQQAQYTPYPGIHSGLATQDYAHFTSPIRRYPDLINHRTLLARIGADDDAALDSGATPLPEIAAHVCDVERELMLLERTADRVVLALLCHDLLYDRAARERAAERGMETSAFAAGTAHDGEIVGLIASGIFVRFSQVFEGFIPARTLDQRQRFDLDDAGIAMVGATSGERLQLGDAIRVDVESVDRAAGRILLRRAQGSGRQTHARRGTLRRR